MNKSIFKGTILNNGNPFSISVHARNFFEAFFLITSRAITRGEGFKISTITNEDSGEVKNISGVESIEKALS